MKKIKWQARNKAYFWKVLKKSCSQWIVHLFNAVTHQKLQVLLLRQLVVEPIHPEKTLMVADPYVIPALHDNDKDRVAPERAFSFSTLNTQSPVSGLHSDFLIRNSENSDALSDSEL